MSEQSTSAPIIYLDQAALSSAATSRQFAHEETTTVDWMMDPDGLGLQPRSVELEVYARIWAVTRNGVGVYCEPQGKLAERLYASRKAVNIAIQTLIDRDLIRVVGVVGAKKTGIRAYVVNSQLASEAVLALEAMWREGSVDSLAAQPVTDQAAAPPSPARPRPSDGEDGTATDTGKESPSPEGFDELLEAYPKPTSPRYVRPAMEGYQALLDEGHEPAEIRAALDAYMREHRERNGGAINKQFLKSFNNFLAQGSGARAYMAAAGQAKQRMEPSRLRFAKARSGGKTFWVASLGHENLELSLPEDASEEELREAFEREMGARALARGVS